MRALVSALAVAGLFAVALPGYAEGENDKHIGAGTVNAGGTTKQSGRAINDATDQASLPTYDPTIGGRSFIDDDKVKSAGATNKASRAVDGGKAKADSAAANSGGTADETKATQPNKKSKKAKSPATDPTN